MGLRKYKRQIAKSRLAAANFGNINKKFSTRKNGVPLWRPILTGKEGLDAERVQMNFGKLMKARKEQA